MAGGWEISRSTASREREREREEAEQDDLAIAKEICLPVLKSKSRCPAPVE
jgi:hypothetical protein